MGWVEDGCLAGVYSVDIDAAAGLAKVSGEVDPNMLLKALARTGMHAKIVWASLTHPMTSNNHHQSRSGCHGYNYSGGSRAFPQQYWWDDNAHHHRNPYSIRGTMPCGAGSASYGPFNNYYGSGYMPFSSSSYGSGYMPFSSSSYYAEDRHLGTNCNIM